MRKPITNEEKIRYAAICVAAYERELEELKTQYPLLKDFYYSPHKAWVVIYGDEEAWFQKKCQAMEFLGNESRLHAQ